MQKQLSKLSKWKNSFCSRDEKSQHQFQTNHKKSQKLKETFNSNNNKMEGKHFCYIWQGRTFCAKLPKPKNEA